MSKVSHKLAPEAQDGVADQSSLLWPLGDPDGHLAYARPAVLLHYRFLDGTQNQHWAVKSTIETLEKPRDRPSFVTWEDCANVKFQEVKYDTTAEIRITFERQVKGDGVVDDMYWSAVGRSSMDPEQFHLDRASMMLAGLPDEYPPSDFHRGNILHEFGHALGLKHEEDMRQNVLGMVEEPKNYTRFDKHSIMVYTVDVEWQTTRWWRTSRRILANDKLSEFDQAFIRLMYPPELSIPKNWGPFLDAMVTAGVDNRTAGLILSESTESHGLVGGRLTAMRNQFNMWKDKILLFRKLNKPFWRGIDPVALRQSGVNEFIGEITQNKLFQGITRNIVHRTKEQYGIPTNVSLPGRMQKEVVNMLGALAMHQEVARMVKYYDNQLRAENYVEPSSRPREETPVHVFRTDPGLPVDPTKWDKAAGGKDFARIRQSLGGKTTSMELFTLGKTALLNVNAESFDTNKQNIDVKGILCYKTVSDIHTGEKAKWTPKWIAFYHDDWKSDNIVACFLPFDIRGISLTEFPSITTEFENVQWKETLILTSEVNS